MKKTILFAGAIASVAIPPLTASAETGYFFRPKGQVIASPAPAITAAVYFVNEAALSLSDGAPTTLDIVASPAPNGISFRAGASAFMPGLTVDAVSGRVSGTPSSAGATYRIEVEALVGGNVVGRSPILERVVGAAFAVSMGRTDMTMSVGQMIPWTGTTASATGGAGVTWSLSNAPAWLGINSSGKLVPISGQVIGATARRAVEVVARTADGREARHPLSVAVTALGSSPCGALGASCADGARYAGMINGVPIFAASADTGRTLFKASRTASPGADNPADGRPNTDALVAAGGHPAAAACRAMGAGWYLPSIEELWVMWTYRSNISGLDDYYYASSTTNQTETVHRVAYYGETQEAQKDYTGHNVRCVRR